ncbi:MAG: RNA-binding S4 domain-containing protein [Aerococcus sp.]|nr:RNA-binding S4 domain-containing protein [Aerococcus sp.]
MQDEPMIVEISDEFVTLPQLLKAIGAIQTGGQVKALLEMERIAVDGELEYRKRRKIYPGMTVQLQNDDGTVDTYLIQAEASGDA